MMGLNDMTLSFVIPCYHLSSVFVPYSLVLFELIGVDPWFQHAFLLGYTAGEYFHCSYEYLFWQHSDVLVVFMPLIVIWSS
jgi:hypothetical protein